MKSVRTAWRRLLGGLGLSVTTAMVVATAAAAPAAAEGTIRESGSAAAIPGSYIVVLKDSAQSMNVPDVASRLTSQYPAHLTRMFSTALKGFSATMNEQDARRLAADPKVQFVEQDQRVHATGTQTNPPSWGLDRIDQRNLPLDNTYNYASTANNVHAYIIDTGIRMTHQTFGGRATSGYDFVDNDSDATDCNGHGTHVAGTVGGAEYGVAKGVSLTAVRVLNCQGSGTNSGVIAGIDWVAKNAVKPAVANMSLGGGASTALDSSVQNAIQAGVTFGVAAGNGDALGNPQDACGTSPARVPEAITVGATDKTDTRASFSNYGTCLDIFAPGVGITSSWDTSDTATNTISGTSMATPHVVGAAALYLASNPAATPQQVRDSLVNNADSGVVKDPMAGSPNKLLYTGSATPPPGPSDCATVSNSSVQQIPDGYGEVTSPVTVSGCARNAGTSVPVMVNITHPYRGDLVIDLISPTGAVHNLKQSDPYDSAANVNTTYTVDASTQPANGTWTLRVRDVYTYDSGTLDSWQMTP